MYCGVAKLPHIIGFDSIIRRKIFLYKFSEPFTIWLFWIPEACFCQNFYEEERKQYGLRQEAFSTSDNQ